ncbi:MAG TPA: hypothetical protein VFO95_10765, partial [Gemmatimonadales bacterium]|nr:hypothetical protein [Gemmatimonadales bacterium]
MRSAGSFLAILWAGLFAGCDTDQLGPGEVAQLELIPATAWLEPGTDFTPGVTATGFDGLPIEQPVLQWFSSAPEVAGVDGAGRITAISPGTTRITAASAAAQAVLRLTVVPAAGGPLRWSTALEGQTDVTFLGLWMDPSGAGLVVGQRGTVFSTGDGSTWQPVPVPTGADLLGVWGSSPSNVYVAGDSGVILHYDGAGWTRVDTGSGLLLDVWGLDPDHVYAIGPGTVLEQSGGSWQPQLL